MAVETSSLAKKYTSHLFLVAKAESLENLLLILIEIGHTQVICNYFSMDHLHG